MSRLRPGERYVSEEKQHDDWLTEKAESEALELREAEWRAAHPSALVGVCDWCGATDCVCETEAERESNRQAGRA